MQRVVSILSALAEPTRLAALAVLWEGGEYCVCELMAKVGASQSRMSRHMSVLKAAGLVTDRRDAQWVRYRRNPKLPPVDRLDHRCRRLRDLLRIRKTQHERERFSQSGAPPPGTVDLMGRGDDGVGPES